MRSANTNLWGMKISRVIVRSNEAVSEEGLTRREPAGALKGATQIFDTYRYDKERAVVIWFESNYYARLTISPVAFPFS